VTAVGADPGVYEAWLGEATELMLDQAGVGPGSRVLDVAAGAGGQTLWAARRTGPDGSVLATDIAEALIERLRANALAAGATHVSGVVADAEALDPEPGAFDAAICRLGLIFLPDLTAALRRIHGALRPGGRLSAIVYAEPERNPFFAIPIAVIRRRAALPEPPPGAPGPFSLSAPGRLEAYLRGAGFADIEVARVEAPLTMASAAECVRFERESFGALHQMLSALEPAAQDAAWAEIERELSAFDGPDGFAGPCELLVAGGRRLSR
jgi:SAM-dependent methyltransferase